MTRQDDSFAFPNFVDELSSAHMDAASMQRMFGDVVCVAGSSPCQLTWNARALMREANEAIGIGLRVNTFGGTGLVNVDLSPTLGSDRS